MIAAVCLLIPPLVLVLIRSKVFPKQEKFYHKILQYLFSVLCINGLILFLLLAFFTNGNHLIYNLNHQTDFALKYGILAFVLAVSEPLIKKCLKIKQISIPVKVIAFFLICAIAFRGVNFIAQPIWNSSNYNPTHGIYYEPENTLETIFVGSSHVYCGISPMELYEKFGICSYDISSDSQPTAASYYWIQEIYRLHSETLDTIVFDVSRLREDSVLSSYHKAIDPMRFSKNKFHAVESFTENFTDFLSNIIPIFSYHERWKELTNQDFLKINYSPELFFRGYFLTSTQWIKDASNYSEINMPLLISDENAKASVFDEKALEYFDYIVNFCEEHEIRLLLIKTPTAWPSEDHIAAQNLADAYDLEFIDFNVDPYYSEIGFDLASDVNNPTEADNFHANYYGAVKITDYLGNYLIEECGNTDVRGDSKYTFMDEELEEYNRYIIKTELGEIVDPADYLDNLLNRENYEIFISVKGDGSRHLTEEQRDHFASLGLGELASLEYNESYLAVIDDGMIVVEDVGEYDEDLDTNGETEEITKSFTITTEGTLEDGTSYSLSSCGGDTAAKSSCIIDGTEYSVNTWGIDLVVYDKRSQSVVDKTYFDTHASSKRKPLNVESALSNDLSAGVEYSSLSNDEKKLYRYDMLVNAERAEKTSSADGLLNYLSYFWDSDDYTIFISASGDASQALSDEVRDFLSNIGLTELSDLQYRDSYIAIVSGGQIWEEIKSSGAGPIEVDGLGYTVISGCHDTDNISSIIINEAEKSPNSRGLNIVVMSNLDSSVVSSMAFDTYEITPSIPGDWPA